VVPGDLICAAETLARVRNTQAALRTRPEIAILTGFPCCVNHSPPTETDGLASGEYITISVLCSYVYIVQLYTHIMISYHSLKLPLQRHVWNWDTM
jgi:hypothetical protein